VKAKPTKTFDAVAAVRAIRDRIYEETKDLSSEERLRYFREHGEKSAPRAEHDRRQD
jgi:hypothetical protein